MANVWKECNAKAFGERQLATHLSSLNDDRLILIFNIDNIPGVREIDIILIHRDIGIFVIEAKTVDISAFESISPDNWYIKNRDAHESPILQAYRQYEGLRDFLKPYIHDLPFIAVTACLPKISRRRWSETFKDSIYAQGIVNSIIFEDDLNSGIEKLLERLKFIHNSPPTRKGRLSGPVNNRFIDTLKRVFEPTQAVIPTMSERERLASLERLLTARLQEEFPIDTPQRAVFTGLPGTGKTFRLLSIGMQHAYAGKKVVFACFNKTLAADIRRLLSFSEKLKHVKYSLEVLDINQLATRCFEMNGLSYQETKNADEWGQLVVDEIGKLKNPIINRYDLILVDESQDMKAWQLKLLDAHANELATVVIAVGEGQELYKDSASSMDWLKAMSSNAEVKVQKLRRNFRNPKMQYFFAQAFFDAWPDNFTKITSCKQSLSKRGSQDVMFERDLGDGPKYVTLPVNDEEFENFGAKQDDLISGTFFDVILDVYDRMLEDENFQPVGMLILVPNSDGVYCRAARLALDRIAVLKNISYIDYTDESARRASAAQNQIRLCTYHSSRGLEGEHIIVFGLEGILSTTKASGALPQNLAFVALSRGLFSTTIAIRPSPRNQVHVLCERIFQAL